LETFGLKKNKKKKKGARLLKSKGRQGRAIDTLHGCLLMPMRLEKENKEIDKKKSWRGWERESVEGGVSLSKKKKKKGGVGGKDV
jgi:hypothetical protein